MSTRTRTRSGASSSSTPSQPPVQPKPRGRPRKQSKVQGEDPVGSEQDQAEKENEKVRTVKRQVNVGKASTVRGKTRAAAKRKYCLCRGIDDGSPMVLCAACKDWYHFQCVGLKERDAEDIDIYICPSCTEKTDYRTIMNWEGPEAVEETNNGNPSRTNRKKLNGSRAASIAPEAEPEPEPEPEPLTESDVDPSSEDEYIAENPQPKIGKRRIRRLSFSSEPESSSSDDHGKRAGRSRRISAGKYSASPGPSGPSQLKRKQQPQGQQPPSKRKKGSDSSAADDPARKYCLGKLIEVFRDIYLRYPYVHQQGENGEQHYVEKKLEELTDEEKERVEDDAKEFANELEQCVYDIYSEPDKHGIPHAGGKYKDRFRMLQFNLGKVDRVVLHKRIVSVQITPKEISVMSSTDLANEETKQSIKMLEKEALEHSILQKTTAPRAKITHKGLQELEDVNGEVASSRERERERERQQEEEERIERERLARLRTAQENRQRTASISIPPESPVTLSLNPNATWGAPPPASAPIPTHASQSGSQIQMTGAEVTKPPLFTHTTSDFAMAEPELNLADLINIDDEPPSAQDASTAKELPSVEKEVSSAPPEPPKPTSSPLTPAAPEPLPPTPTGISPFSTNAPKPETPRSTSFDLNALWSAPKKESTTPPNSPPRPTTIPSQEEPKNEAMMDVAPTGESADDQDFDMFLEEQERNAETSAETLQAAFDALPQVWSGKINMPLDSTMPQEVPVVARQMGGRSLASDSPFWKTLFPADLLRIDGRVPVDKSAQYLLQMRMNPSKELIAVSLSPATEANEVGFRILSDFLIAKGRHGLIFPWGNRPKEHYPGRELYVIPLLSSDPLPDYMEMLDNLRLPKLRKVNYLIGIWVLNKGKLAAPPLPIPAPAPAPSVPSTSTNLNVLPVVPPPLPISSVVTNPSPTTPLNIEPAALAAEVASLTPEQIQIMLRTLTGVQVPGAQPPSVPPLPPQPSPVNPLQPWQNPIPGFGGPPPLYSQSQNTSGPSSFVPPPPRDYGSGRGSGHGPGPGPGYSGRGELGDRGDRGGWGYRGRGRGRGYGREDGYPRRSSDAGWPRGRGRGDGRPDGQLSPQHGQWRDTWT